MKKLLFIIIFFCAIGTLHAKSDIQISPFLPAFFSNVNATINDVNFSDKKLFRISDSFWRLSNQNYLWEKYGFYETVSFANFDTISIDGLDSLGIKISVGFCYNLISNDIIDLNCITGPNIAIYGGGIVLGYEVDSQIKFLAKRRFSPVIGAIINYDFYTSLKAIDDKTYYTPLPKYDINNYSYFYVLTYVAFCINLW